jgi:hypothetical protein
VNVSFEVPFHRLCHLWCDDTLMIMRQHTVLEGYIQYSSSVYTYSSM